MTALPPDSTLANPATTLDGSPADGLLSVGEDAARGPLAPTPRTAVVFKPMPDGGVLFSTETELYFGLNPTGAFIWEHLYPTCDTVPEICEQLSQAFPGGDRGQIRRDVDRMIGLFVEKALADGRPSLPNG